MNNRRKEYTFFWFIENYSFSWHQNGKKLISPSFTVDKLENTSWELELYPRGMDPEDKGYVSLFLNRIEHDDGPKCITLDYEFSVLKADGSAFSIPEFHYVFKKGDGYGDAQFLKTDEILLQRKSDYLPQDILSVRCKIWKGYGNVCNIVQTSARTRIRIEKNSFLHVVENFSKLHQNAKHTKKIPSQSKRGRFLTSCLYFTGKKIMDQIVLSDTDRILHKCELSILDTSGNVITCGEIDNQYDAERKNSHTLCLSLKREDILSRKTEYLPDDILSLICKCTFSSGIELQTIEETIDGIPLAVIEKQTNYVPRKTDNKAAEKLTTYDSVSEDINVPKKNIYKDAEKPSTYSSVSEDINVPRMNVCQGKEMLSTYPSVSQDISVPRMNIDKDAEKLSTYLGIAEDMKALYISQCLTDMEIKTKTKLFPAHKSVLCARSPVFKVMMTNDMKEKITDCIHVHDIEDNIVQQLLLFLYSDNIDNLQLESATQLYYAADKYQIGKLKELCSSFLLRNLTTTNAGEILLLADTHSDGEFKKSVEDFILKHEEEIFISKEWEMLMETNPLLAMKTMQLKYMRKK